MELIWQPITPWQYIASGATLLLVAAMTIGGFRGKWSGLGRTGTQRLAILLFSLLASALLTTATWHPFIERTPDPERVHLVVLIDVSNSVLRADGGWESIHDRVGKFLQVSLDKLSKEQWGNGGASIITFGSGPVVTHSSLATLLDDFARLGPDSGAFAQGNQTNIAKALKQAVREIEKNGGRGAILLATDGNETEDTEQVVSVGKEIARRGIPITVLPLDAGLPPLSITSAYLPNRTEADADVLIRGVIFNQTGHEASPTLELVQNTGWVGSDMFGPERTASTVLPSLPSGKYWWLRQPLQFNGLGLQFVDMVLYDGESSSEHRRRLFTNVHRPVRLLAIGGDFEWVTAISPQNIQIEQVKAEEFSADIPFEQYDGIVLSAVPSSKFQIGELKAIADAVEQKGLGLMFFNGAHDGADEETPTVLRSYAGTAIDPLLPVSTEPRPETKEVRRHVIFVIDASGSMGGWPLQKAKDIASYLIENFLTRHDFLDIIVFGGGGAHILEEVQMHEAGKQKALNSLNAISAGGGSDPNAALDMIKNRKLQNCGLVMLSDGEIEGVRYRPDCRTTVFAINQGLRSDSPLYDLADPFIVGQAFDPAGVSIPYFEPEQRDKFFEKGQFRPLSIEGSIQYAQPLPIPDMVLEGTAVSYAREGADVFAFRPKFADPVLAYRQSGNGYVGIFTTGFPNEWLRGEVGPAAIEEWLLRITPYAARERYDFQLSDNGKNIALQIAMHNEDGTLPRITGLDVQVKTPDGSFPVGMRALDNAPATFSGNLTLPRGENAAASKLIIKESGEDELARPQRIPILIPPLTKIDESPTTEANSFGINETLLRRLADISGGDYNPSTAVALFHQTAITEFSFELWPILILLAAIVYWLAIFLRRI